MGANVHPCAVPLVLGLACRHSQLGRNLQAVCALLRVSKVVQQAVVDACSGPGNSQLQLSLNGNALWPETTHMTDLQLLQRLSFQVKWLSRYGRLVRGLALAKNSLLHGADEALMCVAVRPPLQLQRLTFCSIWNLENPAAVLQHLDAGHLTHLRIDITNARTAALLPAALARLQALCNLGVHTVRHNGGGALGRGLAKDVFTGALIPLTQLTHLSWTVSPELGTAGVLVHLPSSLVTMDLCLANDNDVVALAAAQHLQQLDVSWVPGVTAAALSKLAALTSLQQVGLEYCGATGQPGDAEVLQHATAWAALPALRRLKLTDWRFSSGTAAGISAATSLTSLWLECTPNISADIAAALAPLKQLQRLVVVVDGSGNSDEQAVAGTTLDSSVLSSSVTDLVLCRWPLTPVARTQLITTTQLQKLILDSSSIGDEDLEVMGHYMRKLQLLGVVVGGKISAAGVSKAVAGAQFPALKRLLVADGSTSPDPGFIATSPIRANAQLQVELVRDFCKFNVSWYL